MSEVLAILDHFTSRDTAHHILSFLLAVCPSSTWYNGRMIHAGTPPTRQEIDHLSVETGDWLLKEVRGREHIYWSTRHRADRIVLQHLSEKIIRVKHLQRRRCRSLLFRFKGGCWKPDERRTRSCEIPGVYRVAGLRRILMDSDGFLRSLLHCCEFDKLADYYPQERFLMRCIRESYPDFEYDSKTRVYAFRDMTGTLPKRRLGRCFDLNKFLAAASFTR